ncbi:ABC transporter ATP-binding protein [Cohnella thailandensis]|uniref:ABC transporter ATP-binding protein n=1 Tax=Cohnella thailandensis TaxID=557557 RepID=A0A841T5T6_9BACL|nr:ABC transporter ATP-binding protein [Cohnella thailandensis]MBB6636501.1 ABC transporter ATP-binding protein [Cohnella thailandensis]MBP1977627.1 NitT/TauT family transport system ATP-binding protein [Cohnella thailandensis]
MLGKRIELLDAEKTFKARSGPVQALRPIRLAIEESSFVSIVGPSGCGKSTLMNMIAGLEPTSGGEIRLAGQSSRKPQEGNAIVFQKDVLLEWRSVLDNVLLPFELHHITWFDRRSKRTNRELAMELLEMVGLAAFADKYPFELSGGMRQRVSICRALIQNPTLLMMDEPFGALDALTREQMMYDLLKIFDKYKFTVLFITHSIEEAVFLSDRVVVMSPRPGAVVRDIPIQLERPRTIDTRANPAFQKHVQEIRDVFKAEGVLKEV